MIGSSESSLLKIQFETNPEDRTADQVLVLQSQPVEIIYDAVSFSYNAVYNFVFYISAFHGHDGYFLTIFVAVFLAAER